jgi:large subunit ribosomal protein L25
MLTLKATKRGQTDKPNTLRKAGRLPAVFYGPKEKATSISVPAIDFLKVWKQAGEASIIHLKGDQIDVEALIHDIDLDPVTDEPRHADFYAIEKGKKVKVYAPIEFAGIAPAVKDLGGTLIKVLYELEIEALPKDLPARIVVDISTLKLIGDTIHAREISLPVGVTLVTKSDEVVASVSEAYKEEEVPAEPVDLSAIEVEKKGKEAKEGEVVADASIEKAAAEGKVAKK